ncbi:MAG: FHA domain-containing protein [Chloroflexota bacterium]
MMLNQNDQQIRNWVDAALQLTKDGLKKSVLNAYKTKYPSSYMDEIQEKLKKDADYYPTDIFTSDDLLLKKLDDPKIWFDLMSKRWSNLFQKKSGTSGKTQVATLRELRDKWAHNRPISLQEAILGVEAANVLLSDFQCEKYSRDLQNIRAELAKLETPVIPQPNLPIQTGMTLFGDEDGTAKILDGDTELYEPIRETDELHLEVIEQGGALRNLKMPAPIGRVIVGRGGTAHVSVNDSKVSRVHLMLAQNTRPGLELTDLRSANGTVLNGKRLPPNQPAQWGIGQVVTIGSTWIVLRCGCE